MNVHECSYRLFHEQIIHENFISIGWWQYHEIFMNFLKNNNSWIFMNVHIDHFMNKLFTKISLVFRLMTIPWNLLSWTVPFNVHEKIMNISWTLLLFFKSAWIFVHEMFMNKNVHEFFIHELLFWWTVPFNVHARAWTVHILLMDVHEQFSRTFHE